MRVSSSRPSVVVELEFRWTPCWLLMEPLTVDRQFQETEGDSTDTYTTSGKNINWKSYMLCHIASLPMTLDGPYGSLQLLGILPGSLSWSDILKLSCKSVAVPFFRGDFTYSLYLLDWVLALSQESYSWKSIKGKITKSTKIFPLAALAGSGSSSQSEILH